MSKKKIEKLKKENKLLKKLLFSELIIPKSFSNEAKTENQNAKYAPIVTSTEAFPPMGTGK